MSKFKRVEPDDPRRCQATHSTLQCPFEAVENRIHCPRHGGNTQTTLQKREKQRIYRLSKYQARLNEQADHGEIKSLREEIGISRILLEETMNRCNDATDLILYSTKISDLVLKIEKLVSSCHRLDQSTGAVLDKQSVMHFGQMVVDIIGNYIDEPDTLNMISEDILAALETQNPLKLMESINNGSRDT